MKRTTLLAVGAFVALLAIVMLTREDKVNEGVPKLQLPPLTGEVIAIDFTGGEKAKLEKQSDGWKVNGFPADEAQVKGLTDALKDFHATDFVTQKAEKLAELEVDDAKGVKMAVTTAGGPSWTLVFGKAAKGGGTYVRDPKSNAVFTTASPVAYQVKKTVAQWRNKAIKTAAATDLTQVKVTRPSGAFTLVMNNGTWNLQPPPPAGFRYDPNAAARLVTALGTLQAQDFSDKPDDGAEEQIEATLKDGKTLTLKLGQKRADNNTVPLTVQGDPQVYLLAQWTADQLLKTQEDLRDTSLLAFEPDKVKRLSLKWEDKSVALQKDGASWKVVEPKAAPAGFELDPANVTTQLNRLRAVHAARVAPGVTDSAAGLAKPTLTVELQLDGGGKQTMKFGSELPSKELYVKGSVDGLIYAINNGERQMLMQGLDLFKKRPPPDMSQIRGLEQLPPEVRKQLEAQLRQRNN